MRLFLSVTPNASGMVVIAVLGILFKGISAFKLFGGKTFNEKAILFHIMADIFEWIAILVISIILLYVNAPYLDSIVSIVISLWLFYTLAKTLKKSLEIFLQKTPHNIDIESLKTELLSLDGVLTIEDFHIWSLDGIESILTLKIKTIHHNDEKRILEDINKIALDNDIVDITVEFIFN